MIAHAILRLMQLGNLAKITPTSTYLTISGSMPNYLEESKVIHTSSMNVNTETQYSYQSMIRVFVDKNDEQKQNCSSDTVQPIPTKQ